MFRVIFVIVFAFLAEGYSQHRIIDIGEYQEDIRISGYIENGDVGQSLAVGDVNGDGYDDILIGADTIERPVISCGGAYLILGRPRLARWIDLAKPGNRTAFWGNGEQDYAGDAVDVFDFDGDGLDDLFIAAPQKLGAEGNYCQGKIFYLRGRKNWPSDYQLNNFPDDSLSATIHGPWPDASLGYQNIVHGDINGDGQTDLLTTIQNPFLFPDRATSEVFLIWGGQRLTSGILGEISIKCCRITPPFWNQPWAKVNVFDCNQDGFDDIVLGMGFASYNGIRASGLITIIWGKKDLPEQIDLSKPTLVDYTLITCNFESACIGSSLTFGHINRNNHLDLAVKFDDKKNDLVWVCIFNDIFSRKNDKIQLFTDDYQPIFITNGSTRWSEYGVFLQTQDWDQDGFDDLIITNTSIGRSKEKLSEGCAYVLYGSNSLPDSVLFHKPTDRFRFDVIWGGSYVADLGHSIAKGDVNGDGFDDLILGAWCASAHVGPATGEVYVFLNKTVKTEPPIPSTLRLLPAFPNPFNGQTVIQFDLPGSLEVKIEVFNVLGQSVRTLLQAFRPEGQYTAVWDGRNDQGTSVANGVYIIVLRYENQVQRQKVLYLKQLF